ncbi:MAG: hypothetical protein PUB23_03365 [Bacilli bacterium]|nr:hypothetical protein [Bacilli bacterium]
MYHATNNTFHKGDILDGSKSTQIGLRAFCMLDCSSFSLIESKDIQYIKDQYSSMCNAVGIGLLKEGLSKEEALVQGRIIVTSQIPE